MIFYFTSTGNSLYAARQLGDELVSIAQELRKDDRHYQAERIGIVVPLYEFDLPKPVDEFIKGSTFDTDYFFIISTYGMHNGGRDVEPAGHPQDGRAIAPAGGFSPVGTTGSDLVVRSVRTASLRRFP